jgi:hypothetical protein
MNEVYRREGGVADTQGSVLYIRSWKLFSRGPLLDALVCGSCGYVVLEVPQKNLEDLRETFEKGDWVRITAPERR